jgi:protein phosphatase PTC1
LVRKNQDAQAASKILVDHALARFSTDNLSVMVIRFDNEALKARKRDSTIGVEGDVDTSKLGISEADAIVSEAKKSMDGGAEELAASSAAPDTIPEGVEPDSEEVSVPNLNEAAVKAAQKHS